MNEFKDTRVLGDLIVDNDINVIDGTIKIGGVAVVKSEAGKGLSSNDYTTTEKTKLAGIAAGAQVNTVTSVAGRTGAVTLAKTDVSLGNVANYAVATKAQAEGGVSNDTYMTPLRTKEEIEKLVNVDVIDVSTYSSPDYLQETNFTFILDGYKTPNKLYVNCNTDPGWQTNCYSDGYDQLMNYNYNYYSQHLSSIYVTYISSPGDNNYEQIETIRFYDGYEAIRSCKVYGVTNLLNQISMPNNWDATNNASSINQGVFSISRLPLSTISEAKAGTSNTSVMTPVRVKDAIVESNIMTGFVEIPFTTASWSLMSGKYVFSVSAETHGRGSTDKLQIEVREILYSTIVKTNVSYTVSSTGTIALTSDSPFNGKLYIIGTQLTTTVDETARAGLDTKVDKVSGKDLSTNDYTTAEKNRLANILSLPTYTSAPASETTSFGTSFKQTARTVMHMGSPGTVDLNNFKGQGDYCFYNVSTRTNFPSDFDTSGTNTSNATVYLSSKQFGYDNTNLHQTLYARGASGTTNVCQWVRQCNNGTWAAWVNVLKGNVLASYPVGSIYISFSTTSPASLFGGTWAAITDTFLLAKGTTYPTLRATGGSATHSLSSDEMALHSHNVSAHTHDVISHSHTVGAHTHGLNSHTHTVVSHNHGLNSHTHSVPGHTHSVSSLSGYFNATGIEYDGIQVGGHITAENGSRGWGTGHTNGANPKISINWTPTVNGGSTTTGGNSGSTTSVSPATGSPSTTNTSSSTSFSTGAQGSTTTSAGGGITSDVGLNIAHNNMPPYLVVNMWERVS